MEARWDLKSYRLDSQKLKIHAILEIGSEERSFGQACVAFSCRPCSIIERMI